MDDNTNPQGLPVDPTQPAADVPPTPAPEIQPESSPAPAPESSPTPAPEPGSTVGTETAGQDQGTGDNTGGNPV